MEKLEYHAYENIGVETPSLEELVNKINEIVDWINSKKDQLL